VCVYEPSYAFIWIRFSCASTFLSLFLEPCVICFPSRKNLLDSGEFSLLGADNPGIVHKITSALAAAGLSIDKLETDQEIAPHGGSVLFKMHGTVVAMAPLAKHFDVAKIKADLAELGDSLNCEVTMEDSVDDSYQGSFYAG
jgi:predicted amino acid-binding ACT domain protein